MDDKAVTHFDSVIAFNVIKDMREALEPVAKKHGLSLELESDRFAKYTLSGNVELKVTKNAKGEKIDPARMEWDRLAPALGVPADWYRRTFRDKNSVFEIAGLRMNARKNCICIVNVASNKEYVCGIDFVKTRLPSSKAN